MSKGLTLLIGAAGSVLWGIAATLWLGTGGAVRQVDGTLCGGLAIVALVGVLARVEMHRRERERDERMRG